MVAVFDVVKEGAGGAPVIDITPLFTTNPPAGFALEFKRHYRMAQVDGRRSLVQNVRAFPNNIAIGFYQTWIPEEKDLLKPPKGEDPPPAALGFSFRANLLLLPDKPMLPRCEDERVGYFSLPFNDYSTGEHRVVSKPSSTAIGWRSKTPVLPCLIRYTDPVLSEPGDPGKMARPFSNRPWRSGAVLWRRPDSRMPSRSRMRPARRTTPIGIRSTCATR